MSESDTDDDFGNLTNATSLSVETATIDDVLATVKRFRDPPIPVAVKLHPDDIVRLQHACAPTASAATIDAVLPFGAVTRYDGLPVYPDESCTRGKPRWVYADEAL